MSIARVAAKGMLPSHIVSDPSGSFVPNQRVESLKAQKVKAGMWCTSSKDSGVAQQKRLVLLYGCSFIVGNVK